MRFGIRWLMFVTLALGASPASAQPLFRYEHNWTVTIGGQMYGLRQVLQTPGDFRRTQVWFGRLSFDVRGPAVGVITLALVSPAHLVLRIDWGSFSLLP